LGLNNVERSKIGPHDPTQVVVDPRREFDLSGIVAAASRERCQRSSVNTCFAFVGEAVDGHFASAGKKKRLSRGRAAEKTRVARKSGWITALLARDRLSVLI